MQIKVTAKATLFTHIGKQVDIHSQDFSYIWRPPMSVVKMSPSVYPDLAILSFREYVRNKMTMIVSDDADMKRRIEQAISDDYRSSLRDVDHSHYTYVNQTRIRFENINTVIQTNFEMSR